VRHFVDRAGEEARERTALRHRDDGWGTRHCSTNPVDLPFVRQVGHPRETGRQQLPEQVRRYGRASRSRDEQEARRVLPDDPAIEDDQALRREHGPIHQRTIGRLGQVVGNQSLEALQRPRTGNGEDGRRHAVHEWHVPQAVEALGGQGDVNHGHWTTEGRRERVR
jgi:hypothetical protein